MRIFKKWLLSKLIRDVMPEVKSVAWDEEDTIALKSFLSKGAGLKLRYVLAFNISQAYQFAAQPNARDREYRSGLAQGKVEVMRQLTQLSTLVEKPAENVDSLILDGHSPTDEEIDERLNEMAATYHGEPVER